MAFFDSLIFLSEILNNFHLKVSSKLPLSGARADGAAGAGVSTDDDIAYSPTGRDPVISPAPGQG